MGEAPPLPDPAPPPPAQDGIVRTALAVEPRDGRLCVFMPYVGDARGLSRGRRGGRSGGRAARHPVHIEGYAPPADPRLDVIKVTPDPGVIEVNLHRRAQAGATRSASPALYEEARADAARRRKVHARRPPHRHRRRQPHRGRRRHAGRQPVPAPARSARRASSLYWQHHPSLSYLFSGLFIGPTSQAPRIDEARHEALYELEIALAQVPKPRRRRRAPWLVDRLFRNLLVDVTGNTHRAEICIDKLYSPDGPTGRLGLVEFRAFEMPPHARMSLAQQLLMRALIAWFWERAASEGAACAGARRCTIASCCRISSGQDFRACSPISASAGYASSPHWFAAHVEFRFPCTARSSTAACDSSCATRSSRGTCSARSVPAAAPRAPSTPRSSGCR